MTPVLGNFLKVTFRNFKKNRLFSAINIFGLSIGMAAFIIIMLWVKYELSWDRFHENSGQIYRLISYTEQGGKPFRAAVTPAPSGKYLMDKLPEIYNYTTLRPSTANMLVSVVNEDTTHYVESFYEQQRIYADSNFVITSVFNDIPDNSHIKFDFVIPWEYLVPSSEDPDWNNFYFNNIFT